MLIMSIGKPNLGEFGTILGFQAMTRFLKQIRNGNEVLWTGVGKRWAMMFTVVPPALGSPWFCGLLDASGGEEGSFLAKHKSSARKRFHVLFRMNSSHSRVLSKPQQTNTICFARRGKSRAAMRFAGDNPGWGCRVTL